jgi:hypothetical protein
LSNIIFYPADLSGCGYLRCVAVQQILNNYNANVKIQLSLQYIHPDSLIKYGINTVVFHRAATPNQKIAWDLYKNICKRFYMLDDDMFNIPEYNKNAHLFYNQEKIDCALSMMREADMVIVLNDVQKQLLIDRHVSPDRITILPNYLPPWYNISKKRYRNKKPVVLCALSSSYNGEYEWLIPLIEKTKSKWQWKISGITPPDNKIDGIEYHEFFHPTNYLKQLHELLPNVGLNIKLQNKFNMARQSLKPLEYALLGIPAITSKFQDFQDPNAVVKVENDYLTLEHTIDSLLLNKQYRKNIIRKQYNIVKNKWLHNNINQWIQLFHD